MTYDLSAFEKPCPDGIPPLIFKALKAHVVDHQPVGHFVTAVLENDLKQAILRADPDSLAALKRIVLFCYNDIPSPAWGSPEKIQAWLSNPS
jgi:hypothetical protein